MENSNLFAQWIEYPTWYRVVGLNPCGTNHFTRVSIWSKSIKIKIVKINQIPIIAGQKQYILTRLHSFHIHVTFHFLLGVVHNDMQIDSVLLAVPARAIPGSLSARLSLTGNIFHQEPMSA